MPTLTRRAKLMLAALAAGALAVELIAVLVFGDGGGALGFDWIGWFWSVAFFVVIFSLRAVVERFQKRHRPKNES